MAIGFVRLEFVKRSEGKNSVAKSAYNSAAAGSVEQADAQIAMEVNKAMGLALGVSLG